MANANSYYLYQKCEKRGDQPWIPLDVYSIDGNGTMPLVLKEHSSDSCPVIPDGTDDYVYTEWRSADGYMCDDGTKYTRERRYVSNDNVNWTATDIYRITDTVIQYNSTDCGYSEDVEEYDCEKWEVVANDYICNEGNKYQKLRKYVRACNDCDNCESSWVGTSMYKIGDTVLEYNSTECGYSPSTQEFRWINVGYVCVGNDKCHRQQRQVSYTYGDSWENLSEYRNGSVYQKDSSDCTDTPVIYRWENINPSQDYYCEGNTKYYKQQYQKSYDNGSTWVNETPPRYRKGSVAEIYSHDCGFTGETIYRWVETSDYICIEDEKLIMEIDGVTSKIVEYDGNTVLTKENVASLGVDSVTYPSTLYIGNQVTEIASGASSNIGTSIEGLGSYKFTKIVIPNSVTTINRQCFANLPNLTKVETTDNIAQPISAGLGSEYFGWDYSLQSVALPRGSGASVEIPSSWTVIPYGCFFSSSGLTSVTIPTHITVIDSYAFMNDRQLEEIIIPDNVTTIGENAFCQSTMSNSTPAKMKTVIIGSGCTSIGFNAFDNCTWTFGMGNGTAINTSLDSFTIYATTPPTKGSTIFGENYYNNFSSVAHMKIYVPAGSVSAYKSAWSSLANYIYPIS